MQTHLSRGVVRCARFARSSTSRCGARQHQSGRVILRRFPPATRYLHVSPSTAANPAQTQHKDQVALRSRSASAKRWEELSGGQKLARTASTGASALTIVVGLLITGAVFTFVYLEVIAPDSATSWFNIAHDRVKEDPRCVKLLGDGKIKAYGEPTSNRWARNRPIASSVAKDRSGAEHLRIRFNVEGNLAKGVVYLHLIKRPDQSTYNYVSLFLDVPGKSRVYLENADAASHGEGGGMSKRRGFLGVKWGW